MEEHERLIKGNQVEKAKCRHSDVLKHNCVELIYLKHPPEALWAVYPDYYFALVTYCGKEKHIDNE